jgi:hypothetical protein
MPLVPPVTNATRAISYSSLVVFFSMPELFRSFDESQPSGFEAFLKTLRR